MRLWWTLALCLWAAAGPALADLPRPESLSQTLEMMAEALTESLPETTVTIDTQAQQLKIGDDPANPDVVMNPHNLHRQLRRAATEDARTLILADFLATLEQALEIDPIEKSLDQIRPVVRAPLDFGQTPPGAQPVFSPFVGDLVIYYVWDSPDSVSYVTPADLQAFDLTLQTLDARARINFEQNPPDLKTEDYGVILLVADGFYESSFLLDKPLWDGIEESFGPVLVVAPARDAVLFAPAARLDLRGDLLSFRQDILDEAAYPLSRRLYLWREGAWRVVNDTP